MQTEEKKGVLSSQVRHVDRRPNVRGVVVSKQSDVGERPVEHVVDEQDRGVRIASCHVASSARQRRNMMTAR